MAAKAGQQKEVTIFKGQENEQTFLLQHCGVREGVKLRGRSKDAAGNLDEEKYYTELMKHVVFIKDGDSIKNVTWEYFEENDGLMEVMAEASNFLIGRKDQ